MKYRLVTYHIGLVASMLLMPLATVAQQRQGVVMAADTKLPLRDALLRWDNDSVAKTIWNGTFYIPNKYNRLTVSHPKYETRSLKHQELVDTIYLLPSVRMLNEVIVYGTRKKQPDYVGIGATDRQLIAAQTNGGADLLGVLRLLASPLVNKIQRNKQLKTARKKQIIDNY